MLPRYHSFWYEHIPTQPYQPDRRRREYALIGNGEKTRPVLLTCIPVFSGLLEGQLEILRAPPCTNRRLSVAPKMNPWTLSLHLLFVYSIFMLGGFVNCFFAKELSKEKIRPLW